MQGAHTEREINFDDITSPLKGAMKLHSSPEMPSHRIPARLLCLVIGFSFFKSFSPILSYWIPYMVQEKGLTTYQITNQVLPIYTYATLVFTLLAAPACEVFTCKTVIVGGTFTSVFGLLLIRFGTSFIYLFLMEVSTACAAASSYIYQAYLFILVSEEKFQTMTGVSEAGACMAYFLSAELGQVLVLYGISYNLILYITMAASVTTCVISFMLPKADDEDQKQQIMLNPFSKNQGFLSVLKATWKDSRLQLLSIWWAFAMAGFELALNYSTTLFAAIDSASTYNGQVLAVGTALAVVTALSSVYLKRFLTRLGGFVYIVGSITFGALCFGLAYTGTLWVAYIIFVIMLGVEKLLMCFLFAQCGSLVKNEKYALMFSFNCGLAQVAQSVIQACIEVGGADIFAQYVVLGGFFVVIGLLFSVPYGMMSFKSATLEIASQLESGPEPIKVEPVYQPLLANEDPV